MANFILAVGRTLEFEGEYANVEGDAGGETYKGISRRFNPAWDGWPAIDRAKAQPDFPACLESDSRLQDAVVGFYRANYWRPLHCDSISNQDVANELFDTAVLNGVRSAVMILQGALTLLGSTVTVDGVMGTQTIAALNRFSNYPKLLKCMNGLQFTLLVVGASNAYEVIAMIRSREEQLQQFLLGWLNRV